MKNTKFNGFTLIELMITLAILAIILMGMVSMGRSYVINSKVRTISEELRDSFLYARSEAIKRNTLINVAVGTNGSWSVTTPFDGNKEIQSSTTNSANVSVTGLDANGVAIATTSFTGSGRPSVGVIQTFDITPKAPATCRIGNVGDVTCLRVIVSTGGQVKICNPNATNTVYGCV